MNNFSELSLSPVLQTNLLKHGFTTTHARASLAIEPALAGRDVVATAQTGTGKTLAFVLPLIQSLLRSSRARRRPRRHPQPHPRTRHPNPRDLRQDGRRLRHPRRHRRGRNERKTRNCNPSAKARRWLIATPGRLYDFLSRQLVNLGGVRILVLDEADRMLDMGFLPTIKRIMAATPAGRQTMFFSATIESSVKHLVETHVRNAVRIEGRLHHQAIGTGGPASLRSGAGPKAGAAGIHAAREEGLVPGLRPHQARRRPAGEATRRAAA